MDELAKRFETLAEQYGPRVVDSVLNAARVEALSTIVSGVFCLVLSAALFWLARYFWRRATQEQWDEIWMLFWGGICFFGMVLAIVGIWNLIDPWTWTAISHPELWIAKKVLKL